MHDGWDRGQQGERIVDPTVVKGARGGTVTFSGQIQIDVGLPGQDRSFVTLEIVWTHVRIQVTPVAVGCGRVTVVTAFIGGVMMTDRSRIRINRRGFDTGETGHSGELLSWDGFWGFELPVDVVRSRGGKWERCAV